MAGSMAAFTINDAFMKSLSGDLHLVQAIFVRSIGVIVLLALLAWSQDALRLRVVRRDLKLIALRSGAEIVAIYLFMTALFNMPLANAAAILQALPLAVTLAGAVFLGEAVGWRRIGAILIGFVGVLLIVQPGGAGFTVYSLYALGAVAFVTIRDLAARRLSAEIPSLMVALLTAISICAAFGLASLGVEWQPFTPAAWGNLIGAGVFVLGGYVFSVAAMRVGEIGMVSQFRYTALLVALVLGLAVFGEWPDPLTLLGAAIVVGTGLFTLWRERHVANAE
jgi:S-adenosylmethionine uptake transporter